MSGTAGIRNARRFESLHRVPDPARRPRDQWIFHGAVTAEEALDYLRQVHLDELGIPGLSARWWAVKELVGAERSIVESLGIVREVSELPRTLT